MFFSNIYVDEDDQMFETNRKINYSVTAPRDNTLLGCGNAQFFETPRIDNNSVTAPSDHILLGSDEAQYFENPPKTITVSLHQSTRFLKDRTNCNVNTRTEHTD